MFCNFCMKEESIISKNTCCTGCTRLKLKNEEDLILRNLIMNNPSFIDVEDENIIAIDENGKEYSVKDFVWTNKRVKNELD